MLYDGFIYEINYGHIWILKTLVYHYAHWIHI